MNLEKNNTKENLDQEQIQNLKKLINAGRITDAEKKIKHLILKHPKSFTLLNILGVILINQNKLDEAIKNYIELIEIKPDFPEAYNNLATIYIKLNQTEEAKKKIEEALRINPNLIEANLNLAKIYLILNKPNEVEKNLENILKIKLNSPQVYFDIALIYEKIGNLSKTIENYQSALKIKPNFAEAYNNLGKILFEIGKLEDSIFNCQQAIKYKDNFAVAYYNLGKAYRDLGEFTLAVENNKKAIEIDPNFSQAHNNLGNAFKELGKFNEAASCFKKALKINPNFTDAHYNESYLKLLLGEFDTGWKKYEYRWLVKDNFDRRHQNIPLWTGNQSVSGKKILVWSEQGLGDCIQFCRYILNLLEMNAQVIIEVSSSLKKLIETISQNVKVVTRGDAIEKCDYQIPVMSLPLAFKTNLNNVPKKIPYFNIPDDLVKDWSIKLGPKKKPRIGLTWSGNPNFKRDKIRSISLKILEPILSDKFEFLCLQKDVREEDLSYLKNSKIKNLGNENFLNTAAIIKNTDLVISTCTSMVHLSGAIGSPTWLLLGFVADWRWLTERNDSPWYPTIKIFKQKKMGEWDYVIQEIKKELVNF